MNLTCSTRDLKLSGSCIASSESTFRLTCIFSSLRPCINVEYATYRCNEMSVVQAQVLHITRAKCVVAGLLLTPCCLLPAFMRCIHNDRMSLFFCRRSRYAYCRAFSTRSLAMRKQLLFRPRKPLASLKILSLCILSLSTPLHCKHRHYCEQAKVADVTSTSLEC